MTANPLRRYLRKDSLPVFLRHPPDKGHVIHLLGHLLGFLEQGIEVHLAISGQTDSRPAQEQNRHN